MRPPQHSAKSLMNRRKAREYALQMLFQRDFTGEQAQVLGWEEQGKGKKLSDQSKVFAQKLVEGTLSNLTAIDGAIQRAADNWDLKRMAAVDRNILRFAVYEIIFRNDIPSAVTINEALEIAKKYSSSESVPFINGLLDKIAHDTGKS